MTSLRTFNFGNWGRIGNKGTFCLVVAAIALFMMPLASSAGAQAGDRDAAKKFYKQGKVLYDAGEFEAAKTEFEAAYNAQPHPVVLKSLAECNAALGDIMGAIETLEKALAESDVKGKPDIEKRLTRLQGLLVPLDITSDPPAAAISLDGEDIGKMTPATIKLNPGDYNVTLTLDGYAPISKSASLKTGSLANVSVDFAHEGVVLASPADDSTTDDTGEENADELDDDKEGLPTGFWISAAVTGVGLVSGTVFGAMALGTQKDFDASIDENNPDEQLSNTGKTQATLSDVSFGIAAAGAIVGTIILISHKKKETNETGAKLNIFPVAGRETVGINAVIEF